jgi:hypothetical protein
MCGRKCRKKKRDRNETVRESASESLRMVQEKETGGERKIGKKKQEPAHGTTTQRWCGDDG